MQARDFDHVQDFLMLKSWLIDRDGNPDLIDNLPHIGRVIEDKRKPIAAGFIRYVEGGYGIFDGIITDPKAPGSQRNKALDELVVSMIARSREAGLKNILAYSLDENTILRAKKHNFKHLTHTLMVVDLHKGDTP